VLTELSEGTTLEEVQAQTGFPITCAPTIGRF
jgi:acyl CoA:acetate/3-ketoacid CoA transferase beta subunit